MCEPSTSWRVTPGSLQVKILIWTPQLFICPLKMCTRILIEHVLQRATILVLHHAKCTRRLTHLFHVAALSIGHFEGTSSQLKGRCAVVRARFNRYKIGRNGQLARQPTIT
jgi:hypothetical protein